MRPRQLAILCAAVGALLATRPAGATARDIHEACAGTCDAVGRWRAPWGADTTATPARARRGSPRRRGRAARPQPPRRDTVTVVRVDTVRVRDTVTVERTLPAPPQRVDTVRLVEPGARRRP